MLSIKPGVSLIGLRPEMLVALQVVASVYDKYNKDCVITSCTDGTHSSGSRHYPGFALDFRTRHLTDGQAAKIGMEIKEALGAEFDVIIHETHIHVEFDPKKGVNL